MKGSWPRRGNRRPRKEPGLVGREAGVGGTASGWTAGPSFPGGACQARVRLSPTAVPRRQLHIAASGLGPALLAGRSEREAALSCEQVNTEMGGGGGGARDARLRGGSRQLDCPPAGPAAPPSASASRPGRAELPGGLTLSFHLLGPPHTPRRCLRPRSGPGEPRC